MMAATEALLVSRVLAASMPAVARKAAPIVDGDKASIARRRAAHRLLVVQYQLLRSGECGPAGVRHAERWLTEVGGGHSLQRCPGSTRKHDACGELDWVPYSCHHPLCPDCGSREAHRLAAKLQVVLDVREPLMRSSDFLSLRTYTLPNVPRLTRDVLDRVQGAARAMRRSVEYRRVTEGGFCTIETTYNTRRGDWHPHAHELTEGSFWPQWPVTDVSWSEDDQQWLVIAKWNGAALTWSRCLHKAGLLPNFDAKLPSSWAFVDLRRADEGAAIEVAKYVAKPLPANVPVSRVLELAQSLLGDDLDKPTRFRRRDLFGSWRGIKPPKIEGGAAPVDAGDFVMHDCGCPTCPAPDGGSWSFVSYGIPDEHELWHVPESRRYLVVETVRARGWKRNPRTYDWGRLGRSDDSGWK